MTVVLDDVGENVLLMWRHRFIIDRWVWELPGGYTDDGEDGALGAAREVEEETGWRPRSVEYVLTFQPMIGNGDFPQDLYLARGAEQVGEPEVDEAELVRWIPLKDAPGMIWRGEIVGGRDRYWNPACAVAGWRVGRRTGLGAGSLEFAPLRGPGVHAPQLQPWFSAQGGVRKWWAGRLSVLGTWTQRSRAGSSF